MIEPIVTICIPYAKHHREHVKRAVDSAYRQTMPCLVQIKEDIYSYGAGATRNAILASVRTPFVVWLDADDTLSPTFVETCLRAWKRGTYVYTDWQEDGVPQDSPKCDEWITGGNKTRIHLVTTLTLTEAARRVKGFDPYLPGAEDTDFYLKLRALGLCPVRVAQPLVHYSGDGQRSEAFKRHKDREPILRTMFEAYKDKIMDCNCGVSVPGYLPQGGKQEGDVIAEALYAPAKEFGLGGRFYPRPTHQGARMWVARADVAAFPNKWRMVDDPDNIAPDVDGVIALALAGLEEIEEAV